MGLGWAILARGVRCVFFVRQLAFFFSFLGRQGVITSHARGAWGDGGPACWGRGVHTIKTMCIHMLQRGMPWGWVARSHPVALHISLAVALLALTRLEPPALPPWRRLGPALLTHPTPVHGFAQQHGWFARAMPPLPARQHAVFEGSFFRPVLPSSSVASIPAVTVLSRCCFVPIAQRPPVPRRAGPRFCDYHARQKRTLVKHEDTHVRGASGWVVCP